MIVRSVKELEAILGHQVLMMICLEINLLDYLNNLEHFLSVLKARDYIAEKKKLSTDLVKKVSGKGRLEE